MFSTHTGHQCPIVRVLFDRVYTVRMSKYSSHHISNNIVPKHMKFGGDIDEDVETGIDAVTGDELIEKLTTWKIIEK